MEPDRLGKPVSARTQFERCPMRSRYAALCGLIALFVMPAAVQADPPVVPDLKAGHNLSVRKGKETLWDKAQVVGVEVYTDPAADTVLAINSAGHITVAPGTATPTKKQEWYSGLSLPVRTADQEKFTDNVIGVEVFKDAITGMGLYVSDKGGLAVAPNGQSGKPADFFYALKLKVRKPGQAKFDDAKAFGVEVYKDNNTGGAVYVSDTGMIATAKAIPAKAPETKDIKKPKALYGLEAKARKWNEADFVEAKTTKYGIEVFKDEHTGTLVYISETGSIAAVPAPAELKEAIKLEWKHGFVLKARPGGENELAKATKYGVEVYKDLSTGNWIYLSETGSIAVIAPK